MRKIDKAAELQDDYGIDMDETMILTDDEVRKMYPEVDGEDSYLLHAPSQEELEVMELESEIDDLEKKLEELSSDIAYLVSDEIPMNEELVESSSGYALTEARNDLYDSKRRLASYTKEKDLTEQLIIAKREKLSRLLPKEKTLFDDPCVYEKEMLEEELAQVESRLAEIKSEVKETIRLKEAERSYSRRIELDEDLRNLSFEESHLLQKKEELVAKIASLGAAR